VSRATRTVLVGICVVALAGSGCVNRTTRVAEFSTAHATTDVREPVPFGALYRVSYAPGPRQRLHDVPGTARIVSRGEVIGFTRSPEGRIIAVAGEELIRLGGLPSSARYFVWTTTKRRPSQFSREVGKATVVVAVVVALLAVGLTIAILEVAIDENED
jgi:hypothetical protein